MPLLLSLAAIGACAVALSWPRGTIRRASQTARMVGVFAALLVPSLAMYPSLHAFATEAKDRLVAEQYGPAAVRQRDDLQTSLNRAGEEIDALPSLSEFLIEPADDTESTDAPSSSGRRPSWRGARHVGGRAVRADGRLVSRFALNLPEYATTHFRRGELPTGSCSTKARRSARASATCCAPAAASARTGRQRRRASSCASMLDYRTLPFISVAEPVSRVARGPTRQVRPKAIAGRDVEFAVYGWSRAPLYASGTSVWPLPDDVFERMVAVARAVLGRRSTATADVPRATS